MFPRSQTPPAEIGGAYVRRRFLMGQAEKLAGDMLTAEEVAAIPRANLNALVNTGKLELYPQAPGGSVGGKRFPVHIGGGRYHVIEGVQLTTEALSREEADALVSATTH